MSRIELSQTQLQRLDAVLSQPAGKRVGVLGLGVVGRAMAAYLARRGAHVIAVDKRSVSDPDAAPAYAALTALGCTLRGGVAGHDPGALADVALDALAISPGVDPRQPLVQAVVQRGVPLFGELELAGALPAKVIAITGTNGKSTTTALTGALVRALGLKAFVGGNLGDPIIDWIDRGEKVDVAVLELSSFQLETAYRFRADVGVVLNVTPDHGDRYATLDAYAATKARLVENLGARGVAVLNWDDQRGRAMARGTNGAIYWLSTHTTSMPEARQGAGRVAQSVAEERCEADGAICWRAGADDEAHARGALAALHRFPLHHARLWGRHNRENALAALAAVHALGVGEDAVARARLVAGYQNFVGLEHRLEMVAQVDGVTFINDSKATNDEAAAIAVRAMGAFGGRSIRLLVGGRDKGGGYNELRHAMASQGGVAQVIAFGEARHVVHEALRDLVPVTLCASLNDAFTTAVARAEPGDIVLLSPACSSFDEFTNYQERGRAFKAWVKARESESKRA